MSAISRHCNGTTAGGTTVQIWGEGFVPGNTTVYLAGVECATARAGPGSYREQHLCEWDGVDCSGLGVSATSITCLSGVWDYSGDAFQREVTVYVAGNGNAVAAPNVAWSYMNLGAAQPPGGGNDPPVSGTPVVITSRRVHRPGRDPTRAVPDHHPEHPRVQSRRGGLGAERVLHRHPVRPAHCWHGGGSVPEQRGPDHRGAAHGVRAAGVRRQDHRRAHG